MAYKAPVNVLNPRVREGTCSFGNGLPEKRFIRRKEDFACGNCNTQVKGNGYTNHCPKCLCSRHVDVNPGDRLSTCHGMMKPITVDLKHGEFVIIHRCTRCGEEKRNIASPEDSKEEILKLAQGLPNGQNNGKRKNRWN